MYLKNINFKNKNVLTTRTAKELRKAIKITMRQADAYIVAISRDNSNLNKLEKLIKEAKAIVLVLRRRLSYDITKIINIEKNFKIPTI